MAGHGKSKPDKRVPSNTTTSRRETLPVSFFGELKRRNVFRVGIAYGVTTWVLLQITDVIAPLLELPDWAPKLIFLILAIGFFPALIFAWAFELTPEGLKREKEVDRDESITRQTGRKLDLAIIGILAIAVVLLLVDRQTGQAPTDVIRESAASSKSIAVLPFVNMSSDPEQEYFSDGITEEILNSLAAVKELKVAGRTSSFAFKGQNEDLRKIGDTLGVEHILEGSVRKADTQVRITAQLIQVEDGFHLWSETYDRELNNVFAIQEEIATAILGELRATLLDEEVEAFESQRTDPEVYDLYLLAKQRMYSRTQQTIESAVDLLDEAIAKDSSYAPAYAQRAIATMLLSDRTYGTTPEAEAQRQGKRFSDRALELDRNLAEAWAATGLYYSNRPGEYSQAVDALTRALDLNPNLIDASNWLYVALSNMGEVSALPALIESMIEKDPLYRPAFGNGVQTFNDFGMPEKAQALIDRFTTFDPNDPQLLQSHALHLFYRGDTAEGFDMARRSIELAPTDSVARFVWSVALLQSHEISRLAEEGQDGFRIDALDAIGNRDAAFEVARGMATEGYLDGLFRLLVRSGRYKELTDYVAERWPTLDDFARNYTPNGSGYPIMADLAIAYREQDNMREFDQAMAYIAGAKDELTEQGIDNFVFMLENAKYYALAEDDETALDWLEQSVEHGLQAYAPMVESWPALASLQDNPRFIELEAKMIANINEDRVALGMDPIDPYTEFWQSPDSR
jgi:TolB-like protein